MLFSTLNHKHITNLTKYLYTDNAKEKEKRKKRKTMQKKKKKENGEFIYGSLQGTLSQQSFLALPTYSSKLKNLCNGSQSLLWEPQVFPKQSVMTPSCHQPPQEIIVRQFFIKQTQPSILYFKLQGNS